MATIGKTSSKPSKDATSGSFETRQRVNRSDHPSRWKGVALQPQVAWAAERTSAFLAAKGLRLRARLVVDCFGRHQPAANHQRRYKVPKASVAFRGGRTRPALTS